MSFKKLVYFIFLLVHRNIIRNASVVNAFFTSSYNVLVTISNVCGGFTKSPWIEIGG